MLTQRCVSARSRLLARPRARPGCWRRPPRPRVSWVVHGRGFGHGVGMSAYGAYGYALHGKGYRFILGHYYTGTTHRARSPSPRRGPRPARHLRRGRRLQRRDQRLRRRARPRARLPGPPRRPTRSCCAAPPASALADCGRKLRAAGGGRIEIAGLGAYRGALEVVPTESDPGSLNVVNALAGRAVREGRDPERVAALLAGRQLKAQAVAVALLSPSPPSVDGNGFDLYATPAARSTRGWRASTRRTNASGRRDPRPGRRCTAARSPQTFFSACSGGHTESIENVFRRRGPLPGRRPRPLRLLLPAAHLDPALHRRRDQRQARRLPEGQAEAGRGHQARRLAADRRREADRHRRRQHRDAATSSRSRWAATTPG